jgi:hypothetical protein
MTTTEPTPAPSTIRAFMKAFRNSRRRTYPSRVVDNTAQPHYSGPALRRAQMNLPPIRNFNA